MSKKLALTVLFSILGLLVFSWFNKLERDEFYYIHDQSLYMPVEGEIGSLFVWGERWLGTEGGRATIKVVRDALPHYMYELGFSVKSAEFLYLFIIFTLPGVTMFGLLTSVVDILETDISEKSIAGIAFTGGLLYSLNGFLVMEWHSGHVMNFGLLYGFTPLILRGLIEQVFLSKDNPFKQGLLYGTPFLLIGATAPPYTGALFGFNILFLIFSLVVWHKKLDVKRILIFLTTVAVTALLLNLWWLFPFLRVLLNKAQFGVTRGDVVISRLLDEQYGILRRLFLFLRDNYFEMWHGRNFYSFSIHYREGILLFLWSVPVVLGLLGVYHSLKKENDFKYRLFGLWGSLSFVFAILFSTGIKRPLGQIFTFLYLNIPFFNMFGNPGNKFGGLIVFSLVILITLLLVFLASNYKKVFVVVLVLTILSGLGYSWPLVTGVALSEVEQGQMPDNIVSIPLEYQSFSDFVNNQEGEFRVFFYPGKDFTGHIFNDDISQGYVGPDILAKMISKPVLTTPSPTVSLKTSTKILREVYYEDFWELLPMLNVKYIVLRNDIRSFHCDPRCRASVSAYGRSSRDFGFLDVYEVDYWPKIYIPQDIIEVESLQDYLKEDGLFTGQLIVDAQVENHNLASVEGSSLVTFSKNNPVSYSISLDNVSQDFNLVFLESFHPDWKLRPRNFCDRTTSLVESLRCRFFSRSPFEDHHFIANFYANGWLVDSKYCEDSCELELYYWPQNIFYLGVVVSLSSLTAIAAYLIVSNERKVC